jgi:hypothetical protein
MRYPGSIDIDRGGPRQSPPSVGGGIVVGLLLVGTIVAVSYPLLTAAAVLGALTATLYHRMRQTRANEEQTDSEGVSEHRTQSETTEIRERQTRTNGNGCCGQV